MTERRRLPNRRATESFDFVALGMKFTASYSRGEGGSVQGIFLANYKAGSMADINVADISVLWLIAQQHGVGFDVLRKALMRNANGTAIGPLGVALDILAREAR
jgi:hypothetical protein